MQDDINVQVCGSQYGRRLREISIGAVPQNGEQFHG